MSGSEYERMEHLLPEDRRLTLGRFRDKTDAERGLLGDILTRHVIYREAGVPFEEQVFARNEYGKPELQNDARVHFNISHSGRYIVCALDSKPVGIDVEQTAPVGLKIADRFFTDGERRYICDASPDERQHRFFEVWTMKESYMKREGGGLSLPLSSFDVFDLAEHGVAFFCKLFDNGEAICHVCTTGRVAARLECTAVVPGELIG